MRRRKTGQVSSSEFSKDAACVIDPPECAAATAAELGVVGMPETVAPSALAADCIEGVTSIATSRRQLWHLQPYSPVKHTGWSSVTAAA